jgi:hypothetical protein
LKPLISFEAQEGSFVLPPQALELNLVKIISSIGKPLDQITMLDVVEWYQDTNIVPQENFDKDIKAGDFIMSEFVEDGAILRCLSIIGDQLRWETFSGKPGQGQLDLFIKMHRPEDEKVLDFTSKEPKLKEEYAVVLSSNTFDSDFVVKVKESALRPGDLVSECIFVKEITEGTDFGITLDVSIGKLTEKFPHLTFERHEDRLYVHGLVEGEYPRGSFMSQDIIVQDRMKKEDGTYSNRIVICKESFIPGRVIKKVIHA